MDKKAQASAHRGVSYDARTDKFVAEIYLAGKRTYLGSFASVGEAATAYAIAHGKREPVRRTLEPNFSDLVAALGERPAAGVEVMYRGQRFALLGTEFRKLGGKTMPFHRWSAECLTCGDDFETLTPAFGSRGVTRNCFAHSQARRTGAARPTHTPKAPCFDFTELARAYSTLMRGPMEAGAFAAFARARLPQQWASLAEATRDCERWLSDVL